MSAVVMRWMNAFGMSECLCDVCDVLYDVCGVCDRNDKRQCMASGCE